MIANLCAIVGPPAKGSRATQTLFLYPRVQSGRAAPGTYRVALPWDTHGAVLRLVLRVS